VVIKAYTLFTVIIWTALFCWFITAMARGCGGYMEELEIWEVWLAAVGWGGFILWGIIATIKNNIEYYKEKRTKQW